MPSAALGLGILVLRKASEWTGAENGRTNCGLNCVPNDESNCLFKGLVRAAGFLSAAMVLRGEFIIA